MDDYDLKTYKPDDELPDLPAKRGGEYAPDASEQDAYLHPTDMDLDEYLSYDEYEEQEETAPEPVRRQETEPVKKKGGLFGFLRKRNAETAVQDEAPEPVDTDGYYPDSDPAAVDYPDDAGYRYEGGETAYDADTDRGQLYALHSGERGKAEQEARELIASLQAESGAAGAVHGLTLHMLNHSLFKLTLFLAAGAVFMNLHELELNRIRGFGRGKPILIFAMLMGLCGLAGIPGGSGYVSKTLLHESIVEYIEILEESGRAAGAYHAAEWIFLISGGLTLAYMLKLFIAVCVEKNNDPETQRRFDEKNGSWCSRVSGGVLLGCALLIPVLGCTPFLSMDRIAALAEAFFHVEESAQVHYFALGNLKGGAISILIGLAVYLLFVRKALMKEFKSVRAIREASEERLAQVVPKPAAGAVWRYYHGEGNDQGTEVRYESDNGLPAGP